MSLKVYLAGGMTMDDWQSRVIEECKGNDYTFYNPREHKLDSSREYTTWDLFYVGKSDLVFAYMEKDNPSGIGLALEIGHAKANNKLIILVDEKSHIDKFFAKSFSIVRHSTSLVFDSLEEGIDFLNNLNKGVINGLP